MNGTWNVRNGVGLTLAAASLLWLGAGCGGPTANETATTSPGASRGETVAGTGAGPRLVFISNGNSDWWSAVETGMKDGGKEFGARVELRRNDGQIEGQIRLIEDVLTLPDVKGVAISVLEAESPGIADKMRELQKAGKVVITIDSDGKPDSRKAYIGTNNKAAGEVAGKTAATLRPQGGKTVAFVGTESASNARDRIGGFFAGAGDKFTRAEVFEDGNDTSGRAQANVETALTKYPDVGVLLGVWSYNAPRIAEEVSKSPELRKKVTVVTFDLDEQAVAHLEQGHIDASVCQNPYDMGYKGVRLLKALIDDDKSTLSEMLPGGATVIDTGVRIIVPSKDSPVKGKDVIDIKAMKEWLSSKGLKSS